MGLGVLFVEFLQPIAVGVVTVFALLLFIRLGTPRRSTVNVSRRASDELRDQ